MYLTKKALTSSLALTSLLGISMLATPVKASTMSTQAKTQITALATEKQSGVLKTNGISANLVGVFSDPSVEHNVAWIEGGQNYRYDQVVHNGYDGRTYYRIGIDQWIASDTVTLIS